MNRSTRRLGLLILLSAGLSLAPAAPTEADDWAAVQKVLAEEPGPEDFKTTEKAMAWDKSNAERTIALAENFLRAHPKSLQRRAAELAIVRSVPSADGVATDRAYFRRVQPLLAELLAVPALSDDDWRLVMGTKIEGLVGDLKQAAAPVSAAEWSEVESLLAQFALRAGDGKRYTGLMVFYVAVLSEHDEARAKGILHELEKSPFERAAGFARDQLRVFGLIGREVELKFTALDGREVDLAALRGHVVLVDFWATWCGPCIAELPNVKEAYRRFHDAGFEIVSVSLDRAPDRQKLVDLVAREGLAWPQHFDGKGWKNEFAVQFGIKAIPAMLLIDRAGKVVSTSARGAKLGREVERLLGR